MKKYLLAFLNLVIIFCVSAQVRLNEIYPANNGQNNQWIELFAPTGTISDYKILVKYKTAVPDSGFYVFTLSGTRNANNYFVLENNNTINWLNTSSVKKMSWAGTELIMTAAESNQILNPSGSNYIFLLKGNTIVDVLVTGISGTSTPYLRAQSEINNWNIFTAASTSALSGLSVNFDYIQLTNLNTPNQSAGNGSSFSFIYSATGCTGAFPWDKTSVQTKGTLNSGSNIPNYDYWDAAYKLSNTFARLVADFYTVDNNRIPASSPSLDYVAGSPTVLYFKYVLTNTLITVGVSNPVFKIFYDKGGVGNIPNELLDATDPQVTLNINASTESPNTVYINFPISSDMFYTDDLGNRKLRPFFFTLNSTNNCFKSQYILLSEQIFALPVTLSAYSVSPSQDQVQLNWSTSSESNNKGFEVQRSVGSSNNFAAIGFVGTQAKNGNSQTTLNYIFKDPNVSLLETNYYRLKQIDFDNKFAFSSVKSTRLGSIKSNLLVYPNPNQGSFTVSNGSKGKYNIQLLNNIGSIVTEFKNITRISFKNLKIGFYIIKITDLETGAQTAQRIVVN